MTSAVQPHATYDVVVIGLGFMGTAALAQLAERGVRALGVEARGPMHDQGSSHGQTRIFRRAYWEGEQYGPLLDRSYEGWLALHAESSDSIVARTGGLFIGQPGSTLVQGSLETAERCGIAHEYLQDLDVVRRFPAFNAPEGSVGVYEPDAMMLFAEAARLAYLSRAVAGGADVVYDHPVRSLKRSSGGAVTVLGDDWQVSCGTVVLAAGGWIGNFLPEEIGPLIKPMRIPVFDLDVEVARARHHQVGQFPVFLYEAVDGSLIYGLPEWRVDGGVKVGFHNRQLVSVDLDRDKRRPPTELERHELWRAIRTLLPGVSSTGRGTSCIYTMSQDEGFLIGRSTEIESVVYASACSGHGFKFAPAIGEALGQLAVDGQSTVDISAFSPDRLRERPPGYAVAASKPSR